MFHSIAYAIAPPAGQGGAEAGPMAVLSGFMPIILIIAIFYFLMIRPQQKKNKQHQEMLRNLRKGDAVITNGGIYGRIIEFQDDNTVLLDLGEQKIFILRSALTMLGANQRSPVALKKKKGSKVVEVDETDDEGDEKEE